MVTETHLNIDNVKIEKRKPEKQLTGFRKNVFDFLQSSASDVLQVNVLVASPSDMNYVADTNTAGPCEYTVALIIVANSAMQPGKRQRHAHQKYLNKERCVCAPVQMQHVFVYK